MKANPQEYGDVVEQGEALRKTSFKIGVSEAQMIKYLTSLYSDKHRAILSEIASNALDEVLLALKNGETPQPYEIILPTREDMNLRIRDYGRGMDNDFAFNQLTTYGFSTKSEDNVGIGGKGIGIKSPLCKGPFSIETVKDGWKTILHMVPDGGDGVPQAYETSHEKTDEPNGTTVVIPAEPRDIPEFKRATREYVEYMPKIIQPVVKNCDDIEYFWNKASAVDLRPHGIPIVYDRDEPRRYYTHSTEELTFVVGYRPYTVRYNSLPQTVRDSHEQILKYISKPIYIFQIGYLSISDNRETIDQDKVTVLRLEKQFHETWESLRKYYEDQVKNADNLADAREAAKVLQGAATSRSSDYEYVWTHPKSKTNIKLGWGGTEFDKDWFAKLFSKEIAAMTLPKVLPTDTPMTIRMKQQQTKYDMFMNAVSNMACKCYLSFNSSYEHGSSCHTESTVFQAIRVPYFTSNNDSPHFVDDDGLRPLLWCDLTKAKNYKVRTRYFFSDAGREAEGHSWNPKAQSNGSNSQQFPIFFGDPSWLLKALPDTYKVVKLHEIELPKKGGKTASKTKKDIITTVKEIHSNILPKYTFDFTKNGFARNKKDFTYNDVWSFYNAPVSSITGQIYFLPTKNGSELDMQGHSTGLIYRGRTLEYAIADLLNIGALRDGDAIIPVNATIRKRKAFKDCVEDGTFVFFPRFWRRMVENTKIGTKFTYDSSAYTAVDSLRSRVIQIKHKLSFAYSAHEGVDSEELCNVKSIYKELAMLVNEMTLWMNNNKPPHQLRNETLFLEDYVKKGIQTEQMTADNKAIMATKERVDSLEVLTNYEILVKHFINTSGLLDKPAKEKGDSK